jgi:ribosomal protein S18 acetylase RimI-like enzyme
MTSFLIEPLAAKDRPLAAQLLLDWWGTTRMVSRGELWDAATLPGFVAWEDERLVGLATYRIRADACELATLNSLVEGRGVGSALVAAVRGAAIAAGCRRLWLITTNDNTTALRFYQKRGFQLAALHRNALEQSRRLKPEIPVFGNDGIPLRDEIELEMTLREAAAGAAPITP